MTTGSRSWVRRSLGVAALTALVIAIVVPSALADTEIKTFTADFDSAPDPIPAGSTGTISLTITNTTTNQQLGSSDVTAPSGHSLTEVVSTPTGASATIASPTKLELRNLSLQPGASAVFTFKVKTPCASGTYTWALDGKQANSHSGDPGNDLQLAVGSSDLTTSVSGQCRLAFGFTRQPADAEKSPVKITSVPRDPAGAPVQVEVRSADGGEGVPLPGVSVVLSVDTNPCNKTPLTLSGATATTDGSGLATFPNLSLNQSCLGYTLKATDTGATLTFGVSGTFNIFDDIGTCAAGQPCSASVPGQTSVTAGAGSAGYAQVAVSAESLIDCPDYAEASPSMVTFASTTGGSNQVTILISRSTLDPKRGAGSFRVCYASDTLVWTDRNGLVIGDDEALGTPSLLRDCPKSPTVANMPCQLPTKMSKTTVTLMFLSPPGATRGRS